MFYLRNKRISKRFKNDIASKLITYSYSVRTQPLTNFLETKT